jgi:hypothetical protein
MVLAYCGLIRDQAAIAQQIGVIPGLGTAAFNILRLHLPGLQITYQQGELTELRDALDRNVPPILSVFTGELPYWNVETSHALILTGVEGEVAYVNDPAFASPLDVGLGDLLLAWGERDNSFALIQPSW